MPDVTDEIDEMVRAALQAHEGLAPAGYFDALPAKVLARLESTQDEVSMMSDTTSKDTSQGLPDSVRAADAGPSEDSGLHDMKALAHTAKMRISRRITSQHDAYDDSLLSSSTSGLRAVALPVQAQLVSLPDMPRTAGTAAAATAAEIDRDDASAAVATPIHAAKKSKAIWFIGGGLAAAAAVAGFIIAGGGNKKADRNEQVAAALQGQQPERAAGTTGGMPAGTAAATATTLPADPAPPTTVTPIETGRGAGPAPAAAPAVIADRGEEKDRNEGEKRGGEKVAMRDKTESAADKVTPRVDSGTTAPADGAKAAPKVAKGEDKKAGTGAGDKTGGDKAGGGAPAAGAGDKAGGGKDQSIEDLLNQASGGAQKPAEGGGGGGGDGEVKSDKTRLDGKDIKAGMSSVAGKAQACYDQHGVAGHVKIKATVDPSGSVTKADATGEFAGTPTGSCVAAAVKSASFAQWTGAPMTVSYGFTLVE